MDQQEYEKAMQTLNALFNKDCFNGAESEEIDKLSDEIEKYEKEHYPMPMPMPNRLLHALRTNWLALAAAMDKHGL